MALSKGDAESSLGMEFDKVQLAGGKELKIKGTLQAIAPGQEPDTGAGGSGTILEYGKDTATMPIPASSGSGGKTHQPLTRNHAAWLVFGTWKWEWIPI